MKKIVAVVMCWVLAVSVLGCAGKDAPVTQATEAEVFNDEVCAKLDAVLEGCGYEGIVYLTYDGEVVYQSVSGTDDQGKSLTMDAPMNVGCIYKQFCAASIVMLRDQGKLSLEDTLDKYFPEYTIGKDVTLKDMLTMRSGIVPYVETLITDQEQFAGMTTEQVNEAILQLLFDQPLNFQPDTAYEYGNNSYTLLSLVVEMVSGQSYEDFLSQNIFRPLGMDHTEFQDGGIVTTAADMDIWMTALKSGQVVCVESYQEMTTDHSPEDAKADYGYGLSKEIRGGWGHAGAFGSYSAYMYFEQEYGLNFYIVTNDTPVFRPDLTEQTAAEFLRVVYEAVDAADG